MAADGVHYEPRWFTPWPSGEVDTIELEGSKYPIGHITVQEKGINIGFEIKFIQAEDSDCYVLLYVVFL